MDEKKVTIDVAYRTEGRHALMDIVESIGKFNRSEFNIDYVCGQLLDELELDDSSSVRLAVAFLPDEWESAREVGDLLGQMVQNRRADARESEFLSDSLWPKLILDSQHLVGLMDKNDGLSTG